MTSVINATGVSHDTFLSSYQGLSELANLSYFERLYAAYYLYFSNDVIATAVFFFVFHELCYFGRAVPWMIIDAIPYFRKYKIQDAKLPSKEEQWQCIKSILISHVFVEAVPILGFHPLCSFLGIRISVPFPSYWEMAYQIAIFFVFEDTWHYWMHRGLHYGPFYKYIHKQHHRYAAPFGLTAEYAHPIEVALLGVGTVGIPIFWVIFTQNLHMITVYLWVALRLFQAIDAHSGYEFPWSLHHFIPFWAGADHHDDHHHFFLGNYASSFRWWDAILGTNPRRKSGKDIQLQSKIATGTEKID